MNWLPFSRRKETYPFEDIEERRNRLDETRAQVNKWADAQEDPNRSFHIRTAERAAIVNEVLIERAQREVVFSISRILPEEFGTRQILRAAYAFLDRSRPAGMITFYVNDMTSPEPNSVLATLLALPRVRIIYVDPATSKLHFAVADGLHYWFEVKDQKVKGWFGRQLTLETYSMASFSDAAFASKFVRFVKELNETVELQHAM